MCRIGMGRITGDFKGSGVQCDFFKREISGSFSA
jgi:hypothetical protein